MTEVQVYADMPENEFIEICEPVINVCSQPSDSGQCILTLEFKKKVPAGTWMNIKYAYDDGAGSWSNWHTRGIVGWNKIAIHAYVIKGFDAFMRHLRSGAHRKIKFNVIIEGDVNIKSAEHYIDMYM